MMTYEPPLERTDAIESLCMQIAELVGAVSPQADFAKSLSLHRELRIRTIHSSLLIEGNSLDESAVTAILDGKRVLGGARDIREVQNAQRAYALIPTLDPYSVNDLLRAHNEMMEGLVAEAGRFRTKNVGVFDGEALIHAGMPANYVPDVISDLFTWLETTAMHPLPASCVFHYEFEFIHPFSDGNGRIGRLWHTLLLSRWKPMLEWLPVESVIRERQADYYAALAASNDRGSSEAFVEFMLKVIRDALAPFALPGDARDLDYERAISFFRDNPQGTVAGLARALGCSKRTAERIVADLKKSGRLERQGSPRAGIWIVLK